MRPLLEEYVRLEKKAYSGRTEKVKAIQSLLAAFDNEPELSLEEVMEFTSVGIIKPPIFNELIYPVLDSAVQQGNLSAIKLLVKLASCLFAYQQQYKDWKYELGELVAAGLKISPYDTELLTHKYEHIQRYLGFTIHEVPSGVLWDMNGADASQCQELLQLADELESLSRLLGKDNSQLLAECRYYYRCYAAYLTQQSVYASFAAYLAAHPNA
ncbi:hypothetical protein IC235_10075 [Hymenobacter sp. BT664]|uniref:Uncharacterized protein n=1 Tax=Hymenobacter montanus TaxID=2771359 RepID=A0A927BE01_9BACT|nr:hypothetical protein [Hymenobacter montanus]MBD2768238.1 hypothetical protein [Hymenobacter montanus]